MDVALAGFERLVSYEVGEVTAAATYYVAEIYRNLSDSMLASERPAGLSDSERSEYDLAIEEEAQPLEDRSIELHEKNIELIRVGVFNQWVQRSLDELAELVPGRYAKQEVSGGYMNSIDQFIYRAPVAPSVVAPVPEGVESTPHAAEAHMPAERAEATAPDPNELAGVADVAGVSDVAMPD